MRKLGYVLCLIMIFSYMMVGTVYADTAKNLIEWDQDYCESNDDPDDNKLDSMDPGNPNSDGVMDIGSLDIVEVTAGTITCAIDNAYPGYQANINTRIINVTKNPVKITSVRVEDKPDCILVSLRDTDGDELVGDELTLSKDSSMDVVLITRVLQSAQQATTYNFSIVIEARQDESHSSGGGGGSSSSRRSSDEEELVIEPEDNPTTDPEEITPPEPEGISLPIKLPELPITGGNIMMFIGSGAALGGLGIMFKRRRK